MIRVLIVDDSVTARKEIGRILAGAPDIIIAGEAEDGRAAVDANQKMRPDVIVMDVAMPVMSGPEAVARIMAAAPCPIIILSSIINRREQFKAWDALSAGAVACIEKTNAQKDPRLWEKELIRTVQAAARLRVRSIEPKSTVQEIHAQPEQSARAYNVVAVGGSTGSIGVIVRILQALPTDFALPLLLVIHLSYTQDSAFSQWLGSHTKLDVAFAAGGEKLDQQRGRVLLAPAGQHMIVKNGHIALSASSPVNFCMPSVDILFDSLAADDRIFPIAVLLSGIGRDGARGLKGIKDYGGYTICQDESTSVVFGMPKAAIEMGAAREILPTNLISARIMALAESAGEKAN
jgi:two-component system chemotaxis response regulator CheB